MNIIGYAVYRINATKLNMLTVHAINKDTQHPLCTDKLTASLTYDTKATIHNVGCSNCLKKLNPLAIDYHKPIKITKEI